MSNTALPDEVVVVKHDDGTESRRVHMWFRGSPPMLDRMFEAYADQMTPLDVGQYVRTFSGDFQIVAEQQTPTGGVLLTCEPVPKQENP